MMILHIDIVVVRFVTFVCTLIFEMNDAILSPKNNIFIIGRNMWPGFWMFRGLPINPISGQVIMCVWKLVVCWCAACLFPSRNCLWLPLRISSGGRGGRGGNLIKSSDVLTKTGSCQCSRIHSPTCYLIMTKIGCDPFTYPKLVRRGSNSACACINACKKALFSSVPRSLASAFTETENFLFNFVP